jgi:hypothetical protein
MNLQWVLQHLHLQHATILNLLEIMSGWRQEDEECGVLLQGVVDGLTKPRDNQLEKAHGLLERKGKEAPDQVDGLVKLVANRLRTNNNK